MTSQLIGIGRLSTDLKKNVEEAFDQARRAAAYIESVAQATLTEKGTGRALQIKRGDLRKTYLMTVSLHHLSFVVTRLAALQPLGLFKDQEFPYATSIADLDVVTEFCPGPDVLLHYLDRRMALEKHSIEVHGDELSLFGAYLKMRLHPERLGFNERKPPNYISLVGFGEPFDFIMEYRRGDRTEAASVELEVPLEIQQILSELRRRREQPDARWIAFWLLDLRDRELHALARVLREIRSQLIESGRLRWYAQTFDDLVILVMAERDLPVEMLRERTLHRTLLEKYRRKATWSIGFGIDSLDPLRPFDSAILSQGPWEYDSKLEQLVKDDVALPVPGSRLPGPNEPCICGSPKKFKKCCARKIETALRKQHDGGNG